MGNTRGSLGTASIKIVLASSIGHFRRTTNFVATELESDSVMQGDNGLIGFKRGLCQGEVVALSKMLRMLVFHARYQASISDVLESWSLEVLDQITIKTEAMVL